MGDNQGNMYTGPEEPVAPLPEPGTMWNLVLYIFAIISGLLLFFFYQPKDEKQLADGDVLSPQQVKSSRRKKDTDFRLSSLFAVLGLEAPETQLFEAFSEHFHNFEEIGQACRKAGLEKANLIIGVDFTASNEWQGRKSFSQNCLHKIIPNKIYNPYQRVIWILGNTLHPFSDDHAIHAYGFGDHETTDEDVFPFKHDETPCQGFEEVLDTYNKYAKSVTLSGPTSFAPIITRAIQIVKRTRKYHVLVIIADGQVTEEKPTIDAIVEASKHPISIVVVGVGDGPWEVMEEFDHRLPKRVFDNFRFVDYHKATYKARNPDQTFALQALMEIPDQFKMIKSLGYIDVESPQSMHGDGKGPSPPGSQHSTPRDSPRESPSPKRVGLKHRSQSSISSTDKLQRTQSSCSTSV